MLCKKSAALLLDAVGCTPIKLLGSGGELVNAESSATCLFTIVDWRTLRSEGLTEGWRKTERRGMRGESRNE